MKTIVCANQKGGVGKTTILVHLAFYFAEEGKKVAVIDLDHQENASFSLSEYTLSHTASQALNQFPPDIESKINIHQHDIYLLPADYQLIKLDQVGAETIAASMKKLLEIFEQNGIDIVLIDNPPSLVSRLAASLLVSDFVISPVEPETYSIQGISLMLKTIRNIKKINPKLNFLGMLPSRINNLNPNHKAHLEQLYNAYPNFMLPLKISLRGSIAEAVSLKIPVWKIKKKAAKPAQEEMRAVGKYILQKVDIQS